MSGARPRGAVAARISRIAAAAFVLFLAAYSFFAVESGGPLSRAVPAAQLFPAIASIAALSAGSAVLSGAAVAAALLLASAVFGRWYCAALCPLGTLQDLASLVGRRKRRFRSPFPALRVLALVCVAGLVSAGAAGIASWFDPWSLFGRFVAYGIQPIARRALRADSPGLPPLVVVSAGLSMAAVLAASAFSGRWFCGNLCPVGTALGTLNRFAPFRLRLDAASCVACGRCTRECRAACLDGAARSLDSSRCVYCLSCLTVCPTGAMRYGGSRGRGVLAAAAEPKPAGAFEDAAAASPASPAARQGPPLSRRRFIAALAAGSAAFGVAAAVRKSGVLRAFGRGAGGSVGALHPVAPPGSRSIDLFVERCTACGLCVARCPAKILRPSVGHFGAAGILVPRLDYDVSFCQFECKACLDVCPSGALEKLSLARKKLTKIGDATLIRERCIVVKNRTRCGACAEHCPTGAVRMVLGASGLPEPVFDAAICIGCGACHHACPVEPEKAISVAGLAEHTVAAVPSKSLFEAPSTAPGRSGFDAVPEKVDDFPF